MVARTGEISNSDAQSTGVRWVRAHGDALFAFAMRRLDDAEDAQEAVQETLLAALKNLTQFRRDAQERTWLIGILRRKVVDLIRRRTRDRDMRVSPADREEEGFEDGFWKQRPATWGALPDAGLQQEELRKILDRAIDELPAAMRTAFCLREIDQLASNEVCEMMAITPTNLWTLIHRAKLRLRRRLNDEWFGRGPQA